MLLEGVRPSERAEDVAARIAEALERPFETAGNEIYARASIGVALGSTAAGASELLRNADVAMYRAKADAGTSVEVFEAGMQDGCVAPAGAARRPRARGRPTRDFVVHYQPIVALETGRVVGLEALVRWQHPDAGLLQPVTFVPLAEETGLIGRIGAIVLEQSCEAVVGWQRTVPGAERLVLRRQHLRPPARGHRVPGELVGDILARTGLDAGDLMLELTESVLDG